MKLTAAWAITALSVTVDAQSIDLGPIYQAIPSLQTAKPNAATTVNRQVVASSIVREMSSRHSQAVASQATATKAKATTKKGPIKKTTVKKTTAKKTTKGKKTVIKPRKPTIAAKPAKNHISMVKRQNNGSPCTNQTIAYGYAPSPNNAFQFLADTSLASQSTSIVSQFLSGYTQVFGNLFGSNIATGYLAYYQLPSYNTSQCAALCSGTSGCRYFNIYFERDPLQDPGVSCPNPDSAAAVICTLYSSPTTNATATNIGQWRQNFLTVVSGSNGFVKNNDPVTIVGYSGPVALPGVLNVNTMTGPRGGLALMNTTFTAGNAYAPWTCQSNCAAMNTANSAAAVANGLPWYTPCVTFNAASMLDSDSNFQGTYCTYFTSSTVLSYNNNTTPQTKLLTGATMNFVNSYAYTLTKSGLGVTFASSNITPANYSQNATVTDMFGRAWTLNAGYDVQTVSGTTIIAADWPTCLATCSKSTTCTAASYNGNVCFLKNITGRTGLMAFQSVSWNLAFMPSVLGSPMQYAS